MTVRDSDLIAYAPRLVRDWAEHPQQRHMLFEGSLVFADLTGFTTMTERLARIGRRGAEEVATIISDTFTALLVPCYEAGGSLIKFGGDALLLLFRGGHHEEAAAWATWEMKSILRARSETQSSVGRIRLGMTSAIASGPIHAFMAGSGQRELIVGGETVTTLMGLERVASAGETLISPATAGRLGRTLTAPGPEGSLRLARRPNRAATGEEVFAPASAEVDDFVPLAVRRRLEDAKTEPEHRHVAIGFVGIGGLDAAIADDPQGAAEALDDLVNRAANAASDHGAWLLSSDVAPDGAKLIITAGAPVATGHDEASVLLTLSSLVNAGGPLSVRLGANHGTVFFGEIGPPYRRTLTVMGDTVNTAARVMGAAPPDAILAARSMLDSRHVGFEYRNVREIELRGRKARLSVAEVTGSAAQHQRSDAGELVGRDAEVSALQELVNHMLAGTGAVAEVAGPPGSGRSSLVSELVRRAANVRTLRLEATLNEQSIPNAVARRLFTQLTGIEPAEADAASRLTELARGISSDVEGDLAFIARALGIQGIDEGPLASVDPRYVPAVTTTALASLLAGTTEGPLIVIIDDFHLCDPSSGDVIRHLGDRAERLGWLICVTTPEGWETDWVGTKPTIIQLPRLDDESLAAMANALTEDAPLSTHDLAAVVARAGGSPLILREIISARRQGVEVASIPTAVEGLAAMRIDQLDPHRRRQLEVAAVLGAVFDPDIYREAAGEPGDQLLAWDDDLLQEAAEGRVRFANPLIRDVVYNRLPFAYRTQLHNEVADTLSRRGASSDELADHLLQAGLWRDAYDASVSAGEDAEARFANQAAIHWYEAALEGARHVSVPSEETRGLWERIGELRERSGEYEDANRAFAEAARLADTVEHRARLLIRRARTLEKLGSYPAALSSLTRARKLAPDKPEVVAMATARYGGVRFYQGRHRAAVRLAEEALRNTGDPSTLPAEALALMILDMARIAVGDDIDGSASRRALEIFDRLGDLDRKARVTNNLGLLAFFRGDWDEAASLYSDSRRVFERIGDDVNASYGANNLAEIWALQGRYDEAEALFREVRRIWRAADDRYGAALIEGQLGLLAGYRGRLVEAEERLRRSIEQFDSIGARAEVAEGGAHLLETRLLGGDAIGARDIIEEFHLDDPRAASPRLSRLMATLSWQIGDAATESRTLEALAHVQEAGSELDELRILELCSRSASKHCDPLRQQELTERLGMVTSPVYPTRSPSGSQLANARGST